MAVDNDIYLLLVQTAHVNPSQYRRGCTEKDVRNLSGHHGSTPTIGKGGTGTLLYHVLVVLIHSHVRPVHDLHDLPHGSPGNYAQLPPLGQGLGWYPTSRPAVSMPIDSATSKSFCSSLIW